MLPNTLDLDHDLVTTLRRRRSELRESMSALEQALATARLGGQERWLERVHVALVELSADLREHVDITEGPDGLYHELLAKAPRLSNAVSRLMDEHGVIGHDTEELLERFNQPDVEDEIDEVRDAGITLLGKLVRHRQRGADLVFEAYEFDIGGEE